MTVFQETEESFEHCFLKDVANLNTNLTVRNFS